MTTSNPTTKPGISTKDLINLGIFTAIYVVAFFLTGMLGFVPVLMIALPLLLPIVTGIPFMLYVTRVHSFGLITIMGTIVGLVMFATGHGWIVLVMGVLCGLLADLILASGHYRSWPKTLLAFGVFSGWCVGALLPLWVMRDAYFAQMETSMGSEYASQLAALTDTWVLWALLGLLVLGTIIGGYLGRAVLKKHFIRAGIAA